MSCHRANSLSICKPVGEISTKLGRTGDRLLHFNESRVTRSRKVWSLANQSLIAKISFQFLPGLEGIADVLVVLADSGFDDEIDHSPCSLTLVSLAAVKAPSTVAAPFVL